MIVVADSSALIALAAAGHLDVLPQLFEAVQVPDAVRQEVDVPGQPYTGELRRFLQDRVTPVDIRLVVLLDPSLGPGEMQAMALARQMQADVLLIDDLRARRVATANGFQVLGSLGALLLGKHRGLLSEIAPAILRMNQAGIRLAPALVDHVLRRAGESSLPH